MNMCLIKSAFRRKTEGYVKYKSPETIDIFQKILEMILQGLRSCEEGSYGTARSHIFVP